jgi:GNAT superfamily N-acetyltransferase
MSVENTGPLRQVNRTPSPKAARLADRAEFIMGVQGDNVRRIECSADALSSALLDNHLEFLRTHRGDVTREGGIWRCASDKPSFCFAIFTKTDDFAPPLGRDDTLYVPSWLSVPPEVTDQYRQSHVLNYMVLDGKEVTSKGEYVIRQIADRDTMEDFALAQARGFFEDEGKLAEWMPWLREADMQNLANTRQEFFVQYDGNQPVACAVSVYESSFAGVYAVATVPTHRRQGRAISLLRHAVMNASARGFSFIGLQTVEGSLAEKLYSGVGFRSLFKMHVLIRRAI